LESANFMTLQ